MTDSWTWVSSVPRQPKRPTITPRCTRPSTAGWGQGLPHSILRCAASPQKKNGISGERFWKTIIEVTTAVSKWWFLKNTVIFQLKSKKGNTQRLHKHLPEEIMTLFLSFWLVLLAYPKMLPKIFLTKLHWHYEREKKSYQNNLKAYHFLLVQ